MKREHGFTMLEMMITVAIFSLLTALARPDLTGFIVNTKARVASREIFNLLQSARILSAKEGQDVIVAFGNPSNMTDSSFSEVLIGLDKDNDGKLTETNVKGVKVDLVMKKLNFKAPLKPERNDASVGQIIYNSRGFLDSGAGGVAIKNSVTARAYKVSVTAAGVVTLTAAG